MLTHRDLSRYKEGTYTSISVFKNRIEFRNVGNLYGSNTIEKIISERDIEVRNKTTVGILEILGGVLENRHTGVKTMISEMKKANLPKPIFENQREDFVVKFYNGEYPELYPEELIEKIEKTYEKTYEKILKFCNEERTAREIAEYCGYKGIDRFKRTYLKPLLLQKKLRMTIPESPRSKNQKYIIIDKK